MPPSEREGSLLVVLPSGYTGLPSPLGRGRQWDSFQISKPATSGSLQHPLLPGVVSTVPAVLVRHAGYPEGLDGQGPVPGLCL